MKPDKEQEIASKYITGHSLIIAGAGSGKTTTLLFKIDELIKSGIKENEILVISFTNETVNNFISKCKYNIDVLTFHKLANKVLNSRKEIADTTLLEDCTVDFLKSIPIKLRKKIMHSWYYKIYTKKRYKKISEEYDSDTLCNYLYKTINQLKAYNISIESLDIRIFDNTERLLIYCMKKILENYKNILKENNLIDFDGLITEATDIIRSGKYKSNYKHILVDEYQDISQIRLDFLMALIKNNNSILTAVGDDFQSIYGFNGSNIDLFYEFQKYFVNSKIFYITTTYRCPKRIIKKAGNFIMRNPKQIKKEIKSKNKIWGQIVKIKSRYYKGSLNKLVKKYKNTNYSVLILSRNNFDINFFLDKKRAFKNSYLVYKNKEYKNIRFLSIHKSKGLEADIVIVLNLSSADRGFPADMVEDMDNKIFKNTENFKYAEERRLFYVALTRCKKKVYLIIDKSSPSVFLFEI